MKKFLLVAIMFASIAAMAQTEKTPAQLIQERKELTKLSQNAVDAKKSKMSKKEAKALAKEGWKPGPGAMSIEYQLNDTYTKRVELKGDAPRYIVGSGQNTADNYTAAKKFALEFARQNVAEQIGAEFAELTNTKVANAELSPADAESLTQAVNEGKSLVQQNIGRLNIVQEMYREVNNKIQVRLVVLYDSKYARSAILKALEQAGEETRQQLESITKDWGNN